MRDIDASILAELQTSELRPFMLLNMTIDGEPYFFTDCDIPLYFGKYRLKAGQYKILLTSLALMTGENISFRSVINC